MHIINHRYEKVLEWKVYVYAAGDSFLAPSRLPFEKVLELAIDKVLDNFLKFRFQEKTLEHKDIRYSMYIQSRIFRHYVLTIRYPRLHRSKKNKYDKLKFTFIGEKVIPQ